MQDQPIKVIQVQKAPRVKPEDSEVLELLALLCLYYPAYTLAKARRLPWIRVRMMLNKAKKEEARRNYNMLQIVASPHSDKGKAVKQLAEQFKGEMNG